MAGRLAWLVLVALLAAPPAVAQTAGPGRAVADDDTGYVEYLRRQDPAAAGRFVTLRDARAAALAELQQATERYNAGGPALRPVSLPALQQARRRYAEASLAVLDFVDAVDRASIVKLETDVERLKRGLGEREKDRAQLERMLRGD